MTEGYATYKKEEQLQATALAKAMKLAADECCKTFESIPMLNAYGGALAGLLIDMLAAIEDGRTRKQFLKTINQAVEKGIIEKLRDPGRTFVQTVILGGKDS